MPHIKSLIIISTLILYYILHTSPQIKTDLATKSGKNKTNLAKKD